MKEQNYVKYSILFNVAKCNLGKAIKAHTNVASSLLLKLTKSVVCSQGLGAMPCSLKLMFADHYFGCLNSANLCGFQLPCRPALSF